MAKTGNNSSPKQNYGATRSHPMTPRAGVKVTRSRYGEGGKCK